MQDILNTPMQPFAEFIIILLITAIVGWLFRRIIGNRLLEAVVKINGYRTKYRYTINVITALIYVIGTGWAMYSIPALHDIGTSLLASAGILAFAVGLASKDALTNLISGLFIVVFKPFKIGDRIEIQGHTGTVEDISLRHTIIRNFQNRRLVVPNSIVSHEYVLNSDMNDRRVCEWLDFGISYGSDIELARRIMREEILKHPLFIDHRTSEQIEANEPLAPVRVIALGDFDVKLRAWAWAANTPESRILKWDVTESVKNRFDNEGVEIPFPYRTLVYKNDLPAEAVLEQT